MSTTADIIVAEILKYVSNDQFSNWYVGIAKDVENRLFTDHNVDKLNSQWIYDEAINSQHARSAEESLINSGFDGGTSGGDNQTTFVYAYRKTSNTRE